VNRRAGETLRDAARQRGAHKAIWIDAADTGTENLLQVSANGLEKIGQ
jgi:hypothetical protein